MKKINRLFIAFILLASIFSGTASANGENAYVILGGNYEISSDIFVEIIAPTKGSVVYHGYSLMVEAYIEAPANIGMVEFYKDNSTEPFFTDTEAPYTAQIICQLGSFTVHAKAYTVDGFYNISKSHPVTVDVNAGSAEKVYIDTDFDSSTSAPANFVLGNYGETAEICATPADKDGNTRSGNSAHISVDNPDDGDPAMDYYNPDMPLAGKIVIETSVMSETLNWPGSANRWFQLFDETSAVGDLCEFNGKNINTFHIGGRNPIVVNDSLQAKVWYDLKFIIDFDTLTYTVFLNGEQKGGVLGLPGNTTPATIARYKNITRLRTRMAPADCGIYMDYLKIYSLPKDRVKTYTDESFDASTVKPAGYNFDDKGATVSIVPSPKDFQNNTRPGNSIYLASSDTSKAPLFNYKNEADPMKGIVTIEADIMPMLENYPNKAEVELFYLGSKTGIIGRLAKLEAGNINAWNGKSRLSPPMVSFQANKWYHFKYVIDTTKGEYDVEIDGEPKLQNITIVPEGAGVTATEITYVQFRLGGISPGTNSIYADNICITALTPPDIIGTVFTSNKGILSVDKTKAPYDLRKITVDFTDSMSAASFSGVTLKDASDNTVLINGEYNQETKQYNIMLSDDLEYMTEYKLTFPTTVSSADGVFFDTAKVITFTTGAPEVAINSITFLGEDGNTLDKSNTGGKIKAVVDATSYAGEEKSLSLILVKFDDGQFTKCNLNTETTLAVGQNDTFEVTLTELPNNVSSSKIILYIWDGFESLRPIYPITEVE